MPSATVAVCCLTAPFSEVRSDRNGPAPLKIPDNLTNEKVVLALPVRRGGREEVIFSEEQSSLARFITFEQEVEDDNAMSVGGGDGSVWPPASDPDAGERSDGRMDRHRRGVRR